MARRQAGAHSGVNPFLKTERKMENTSGQGKLAAVPPEIDRWNWGAFLLNWIWGIGNNTYIALLVFVPVVNFVMLFVLGTKGSIWAWRNARWNSVEHFKSAQRKWAIWGVVLWFVAFPLLFGGIFFGLATAFKNSDAYRLAIAKLQANPEAIAILGPPISAGMPWGSISVSGPQGKAGFSFSVAGQKAKGVVYLDATKDMGQWRMNRIELEIEGRTHRIDLNRDTRASLGANSSF
jgi:hypothetical protein